MLAVGLVNEVAGLHTDAERRPENCPIIRVNQLIAGSVLIGIGGRLIGNNLLAEI